jgi:hypothetical protein
MKKSKLQAGFTLIELLVETGSVAHLCSRVAGCRIPIPQIENQAGMRSRTDDEHNNPGVEWVCYSGTQKSIAALRPLRLSAKILAVPVEIAGVAKWQTHRT